MDALLDRHGASAPLSKVKLETRTAGSLKRRDLTVLDRQGNVALTGEVKVPYAHDGASPFVETTVVDARRKALAAGAPWFFTWNLNELVLWRTDSVAELRGERGFKTYKVTDIRRQADLDSPHVQRALRDGIERFLLDFIRIFSGVVELQRRPPDEYFVHAFDSFLVLPILNASRALIEHDRSPATREALNRWMRDEQGWTLVGDRAELLARAAKFAVYGVANKLVFYDALRKRFSGLPPLVVDPSVDTGEALIDKLATFFDTAREETGDYETIFGEAGGGIGTRIPFYDSVVVPGWRQFAEQIDRFDLSRLDYDVIGRIFERLIDPSERHKYGQYYTRPEVVDLINAFAIRRGEDVVLDPGCGGGTFLVRAYARKRRLAPRLGHAALLETIYGTDVSPFAANLSTINLATRDLIEDANYPRIARTDFFDTAAGATLMQLPAPSGRRPVPMPYFDAVVGNPPYVRQEDVAGDLKTKYQKVSRAGGLHPNGRSDLHVYFWGHALSLMKPDGRLGFLASSQWLDAEYGFALQAFLLENFRIEAIVESRNEPWFVGARVATVATMATCEADPAARDDNLVRFVELDRPIADLLAHDGTSGGALEAAERFRDLILAQDMDADFEGWRIRIQRQGDIRARGVRLGERTKGRPVYAGDKWGIPLRAPDIWHELVGAGGDRWRPLAELAEVRFGVKSGADDFFYLEDWTEKSLSEFPEADLFNEHYGVSRPEVASGNVALVRTGTGEVHPIEREFLKPIVHSIMSIDSYKVERRHCANLALMAPSAATAPYLDRYIDWGEHQDYDKGATCQQRVSGTRHWYDLTEEAKAADVLWVKERQYRFAALYNPDHYTANCRLYTVAFRAGVDSAVQAAILNSSITVLSTLMYGRPVGVEANWSTMVLDANMLLVPSSSPIDAKLRKRLLDAHDRMTARGIMGFLSERRLRRKALVERGRADRLDDFSDETELDQADRQALDDAVLELLGFADRVQRRAVRDRLYDHLSRYFEDKRLQEEEAIDNKRRTAAARTLGPNQVAADVFAEIERDHPSLRRTYIDLTRGSSEGDGIRIPANGDPELLDDLVTTGVLFGGRGGELVTTRTKEQAQLVAAISAVGPRGRSVFVPRDASRARQLSDDLRSILQARARTVRELVTARTIDDAIVEPAIGLVMRRLLVPVSRTRAS
ncbi:class I SAM-dependent DNA methyltransferase [Sphingomonas tabacisoli]|uniref:site-specific DNA-methyltransferase (adenine-specific) n=1 Tax=Sphingomonas tabacisoli TaxID=2249466 RepID=A0ABW4I5Z5_9SPHN